MRLLLTVSQLILSFQYLDMTHLALAYQCNMIHQPDLQKTVFEDVLQLSPEVTQARFGYMLEAFKYGCPPHGGIALGFDRLIALLCGADSIRDVIAFPKTTKGSCLMTDSPTVVEQRQLRDLHIDVKVGKKSE